MPIVSAHVIVCIDGNFWQKRRKSNYTDPAVVFEGSRFVKPKDVDAMQEEVAEKRKKAPPVRTAGTSAKINDEILDECKSTLR